MSCLRLHWFIVLYCALDWPAHREWSGMMQVKKEPAEKALLPSGIETGKKALSDVVTLMPQRQESPEASLPLPSEENKIGAFQIWIPPMVLYQSYQNTRGYTLHQRKNDSLASAGAAGVSVAYETQFWQGLDALTSFQRENLSHQSKVTGHNTQEVCYWLQKKH